MNIITNEECKQEDGLTYPEIEEITTIAIKILHIVSEVVSTNPLKGRKVEKTIEQMSESIFNSNSDKITELVFSCFSAGTYKRMSENKELVKKMCIEKIKVAIEMSLFYKIDFNKNYTAN